MVASDHRPVVAHLEDKVPRKRGQFWFDKRWIGQEGLTESIPTSWSGTNEAVQRILLQKLVIVVMKLLNGEKNNPPYGKDKIHELQKALEEVQTDNNRSQEEIIELSRKLQDAYKDEEDYWHQKSQNMWYTSGDLNTKFYHTLTKQRRIRNRIVGLYDADENWITEDERVEKVAVNYF